MHALELPAQRFQCLHVLGLQRLALLEILHIREGRSILKRVQLLYRLGIGIGGLLKAPHGLKHQEDQSTAPQNGERGQSGEEEWREEGHQVLRERVMRWPSDCRSAR